MALEPGSLTGHMAKSAPLVGSVSRTCTTFPMLNTLSLPDQSHLLTSQSFARWPDSFFSGGIWYTYISWHVHRSTSVSVGPEAIRCTATGAALADIEFVREVFFLFL